MFLRFNCETIVSVVQSVPLTTAAVAPGPSCSATSCSSTSVSNSRTSFASLAIGIAHILRCRSGLRFGAHYCAVWSQYRNRNRPLISTGYEATHLTFPVRLKAEPGADRRPPQKALCTHALTDG